MRERPIIFSGPMIRAVMEKRKTQTRRVVKPQPPHGSVYTMNGAGDCALCFAEPAIGPHMVCVPPTARSRDHRLPCPCGVPGDRLWVKETWQTTTTPDDRDVSRLEYAADWNGKRPGFAEDEWTWRPSIFMPRWASRLTLEVAEVRVQRLQDISNEDAIAEGARHFPDLPSKNPYKQDARWSLEEPTSVDDCMSGPKWAFANYVNKLHAKRQPEIWDANPWVWAISFSVAS